MRAQWQQEKETLGAVGRIKQEIERRKYREQNRPTRTGDLTRRPNSRTARFRNWNGTMKRQPKWKLGSHDGRPQFLKEEVGADDIAEVVARWTGIPVTHMLEGEARTVHEAGRRPARRAWLDRTKRVRRRIQCRAPLARRTCRIPTARSAPSFFSVQPVSAKLKRREALAEFLFDDEHAMVRIDMSEYMEKHAVARLIGAPPGYVGYEEGGQLTEAVRRRPYSVILFDEIEKAHPDVFNILLQLLDDGRLTDSQGRTVDFRNAVVIMTSNVGSQMILERGQTADTDWNQVEQDVLRRLRGVFKPEFLNRIDDIVVFHPLGREEIDHIVDLQLGHLRTLLADRKLTITLTDAARRLVADTGLRSGVWRASAQAGRAAHAAESAGDGGVGRAVQGRRHDRGRCRSPATVCRFGTAMRQPAARVASTAVYTA